MRRPALWLLVRWRRAWCALFGCVEARAAWLFAGHEAAPPTKHISVTLHCNRCWRAYTEREQQQAVAYFRETTPQ